MDGVRSRFLLPVLGIVIGAGIILAASTDTSATPTTFAETFDGTPAAPEPFVSPHWDVQVHERGMGASYPAGALPLMTNAQHGPNCEGPSVPHEVDSADEAVFRCNDHVMTALWGQEYGLIYLTPDHMADWSNEPAVIQWSMSTAKLSARDWPDIWIVPFEQTMAAPFPRETVDLNGAPERFVHLNFDTGSVARPLISIKRGYGDTTANPTVPTCNACAHLATGITAGTDQSAIRQSFKLTLTATSAKFERLASATAPYRLYWDVTFADLGFTAGTVQFGLYPKGSRTAAFTKTVGSGITITNGAGGICQVTIADTDTDGLNGSARADFEYELRRTDAGNEDVLAYGTVVLLQGKVT